MKLIFTLGILVYCLEISAQENFQPTFESRPKVFSIGVNVSADNCYRTLKNDGGDSMTDDIIRRRNSMEIPKIGYIIGVEICYALNNRLEFESGMKYAKTGYQTQFINLNFGSGSPLEFKSIYTLHYIGMPLILNYSANTGKLNFFATGGFTFNFLIKETFTGIMRSNGNTTSNTSPSGNSYKNVSIVASLGAGILYKINENVNLRLAPYFSTRMIRTSLGPIEEHLWSEGINCGVYFRW